ncbi:MAG: ComF family protein [Candidatus Daviesbacteria bacterium]|nr:ComF family protein [Candidatus Daviesbacteria bacterium]
MGINLLDLLFPKLCVGCGEWGTYFCSRCIANIAQTDLVCPNCEKNAIGGAVHPLCKKRYGLDGLWSLGIYQDPLKKIIQKLKYKFVREVAEVLVNLMVEYWAKYDAYFLSEIKKDGGENWVIIPVPLHPKRENWRGFNQSALIGQILSNSIGLAYSESLKRIRHTKPQVSLKSWQRKQNIRGAFSLSTSNEKLEAMNVLLVDDVWTTGSTLKECCYILKRGGAQKVWAITLAR